MFSKFMEHFETILTLIVIVCAIFYIIEGMSYRKQRKRLYRCFDQLQETANERQEYFLRLQSLNQDRLSKKQQQLSRQIITKLKSNSPLNKNELFWLKHPTYPTEKFIEFFAGIFWVLFIIWFIRSFLWEPFKIPSGSMLPTLRPGDFILTQKFSYGVRLPVFRTKIIETGKVQRGDVAVFRYPENPNIHFIKRIIALPGDRVRVEQGKIYINGQEQKLNYIKTQAGHQQMSETLGDKNHLVQFNTRVFMHGPDGEWSVPENHYFAMGDNRDHSEDSRFWGFIPDENMVGKATFIWLNMDCITGNGRCQRIGKKIQ